MRRERRGRRVTERRGDSDQHILMDQKDGRRLVGEDLLYRIESLLSGGVVACGMLRLHQAVNFGFPWCCGLILSRIPGMKISGTEPNVHLAVGVNFDVRESQQG